MNVLNQLIDSAQRWAMYQGDCVETLRGIPDNSIHYSIFSPPFASLYTYSNSDRDMGNSSDGAEFAQHFGYLVAELYRVIMPGRLVSIDTINAEITALKSLLTDTDYKALKHADGVMSAEEYEPIRQQREEWRDKINALETELATATQEFDAEMTKMAAAQVKEG